MFQYPDVAPPQVFVSSAKLATEGDHMGICGYHGDRRNGHCKKNVLASMFTNPSFIVQTLVFFKLHFSPPCLRLYKNGAL